METRDRKLASNGVQLLIALFFEKYDVMKAFGVLERSCLRDCVNENYENYV